MNRRYVWRSLILLLMLSLPLGPLGFSAPDSLASFDQVIIGSPPEPPKGVDRPVADPSDESQRRADVLLDVPTYNWCFGSAPTAAAMIAAWYDRMAHPDIYTGPTNGGMMPADNSVWPDWVDNNGDTRHQCPLAATHNGLDGRVENGHVDDYWDFMGQPDDPFRFNWPEHALADCTGDFMKSNRWFAWRNLNFDGETTFYFFSHGAPLHDYQMDNNVVRHFDGGYGLGQFFESKGLLITQLYNQYIKGYNGNLQGFTFAKYKQQINAGRPVLIHLDGHTVAGVGYNDDTTDTIYINDCWDYDLHTMEWGGDYSGMDHIGVTVLHLDLSTLVELVEFEATFSSGLVYITWETASELDNAGFNLWRCETKNGEYKTINSALIPAEGGAAWGATYEVIDDDVNAGKTYFYKLEDINLGGDSTFHGPVSVRVPTMGEISE